MNFYEIKKVKKVFKEIIEMNSEERYYLIKKDCDQLQKGSIILWIKDLLSQLQNVFIISKNKDRVGEGNGTDFSYYLISKSFSRLNQKKFQTLLQNSSNKLFLINIEAVFSNIYSKNLH